MPALPNASFPTNIWDADSQFIDRDGSRYQADPKAEDYDRIASEIIATQRELRRVQQIVEAEDNPVSSNTTLDATSELVLVDASSGNITLTLPATADADGAVKRIKKIDNSGYKVILQPSDGSTIDGKTTLEILFQWSMAEIQATEDSWYIV